MRTTYIVKKADVQRKWYVVDATGHTLGRLSSEVAKILRGKHKPTYTPHVDMGDYVIIINAEKIHVTGNKENDKLYTRHTGYVGGLKQVTYKKMMQKKPDFILFHAIKGMLPKSSLGHNIIRNLHVYAGPEHLHEAQKPELLEIKY